MSLPIFHKRIKIKGRTTEVFSLFKQLQKYIIYISKTKFTFKLVPIFSAFFVMQITMTVQKIPI